MRTKPKDGGDTESVWLDTATARFDTTPESETDVCIIGAGIAGLTVAYELLREGRKVVVLDDGPIGGGETGRTSAHLASAVDDHYAKLEDKFGEAGARLVAESHAAAIDYIETTARELDIDCDFARVDAFLFGPPGEDTPRFLDKELAAAARAGLAVDKVPHAPLPFDTGPAVRFSRQAEFHPIKYLRGLAAAVITRGGRIYTNAHVTAVEPGQPLRVVLASGRHILARQVVDATNGALTSPIKMAITQAAYRTYVIGFDIAAGAIPRALYWDTAAPYHYLRVTSGDDGREILLVGGNDHRVGQDDPLEQWLDLEAWARRWFGGDTVLGEVVARWSGQVLEPADMLAHIGKSPDLDGVFLVTGDSGNGLTHATIAGLMLPSLMRGESHAWAPIYDPNRSHTHAFTALVAEAAKSTKPFTDWLRGGDVSSIDDIACGEGAVVRKGLHFIAAYRDEAGVCHLRSATCTHLRGVVHWNAGEKTWDCPCHGSRWDAYGRILNGPAPTDLATIEEPRPAERPEITERMPVMQFDADGNRR